MKTQVKEKEDKVKKYMDAMAKEKAVEEKVQEEKDANKPEPNPVVAKDKAIEETAGAEITAKVKEAVDANKEKLDKDVKTVEYKQAAAKKNSMKSVPKSETTVPGYTSDETWTANMPHDITGSFVQTKIKKM